MTVLFLIDLAISLGLTLVGAMLGFVLVLAGLPAWLLWLLPAWFGGSMLVCRFILGGYGRARSRPGRRPGHAQRPIAAHRRGREPQLEDIYP